MAKKGLTIACLQQANIIFEIHCSRFFVVTTCFYSVMLPAVPAQMSRNLKNTKQEEMDRQELKKALANLEMYNFMRFFDTANSTGSLTMLCCNGFETFVHVDSCKIQCFKKNIQTELSNNSCAEERTESSLCGRICNLRIR